MSLRILVVVHSDDAPPGLLGEEAERTGHRLKFEYARNGSESRSLESRWLASPSEPLQYDALVVLGGAMASFDDKQYPHYQPLMSVIRAYVEAERAVLGLCLGGQLIARAFGASVRPMGFLEAQCQTLELLPAGQNDPLFRDLPKPLRPLQWHFDTFELAANAVPLITGERCANQGFYIAPRCWALQPHFEADEATCSRWDEELHALEPESDRRYKSRICPSDVADATVNGRALLSRWLQAAESPNS